MAKKLQLQSGQIKENYITVYNSELKSLKNEAVSLKSEIYLNYKK